MPSPNSSIQPGNAAVPFRPAFGLIPALLALACNTAHALDRTWIGGDANWADGGSITNWSPNDEPDSDDVAIFTSPNLVNLSSNNLIAGLMLSGSGELYTNSFDLTVDGLVQLDGASLIIGGNTSSLNADNLTLNGNGYFELQGGNLTLDEEVGSSVLDMNASSSFIGNGTVNFVDLPGAVTSQWVNDGTLTALSAPLIIFGAPVVGTLSISSSSANARIDLDGLSGAGAVNVNRNQTLDLNIPLLDTFDGTIGMFQNTTFDSAAAWTMSSGTFTVDNGAVPAVFPNPAVPAGVAIVSGGAFTLTGGTISVTDADGTLQIDSGFNLSGTGTLSNNGTVILNGTSTIAYAAGYSPASSSLLKISGSTTVNEAAGNFNWDGTGIASTTVLGTGLLSITANQVDTTDNVYGGTLTLQDNSDVSVNVVANLWTMAGTLHKQNAGNSTISGDAMNVTGSVVVDAGLLATPVTTLSPGANVTVNGGILSLGGGSVLAGPTSITGAGTMRLLGTSTVTANTTVDMSTFDWDGSGTGTLHTINDGVVFTISTSTFDDDGDMDDPINIGGIGGTLAVNKVPSWTMTRTLTTNTAVSGITSLNGSSRLIMSGASAILSANGQTSVNAPLTFGASSTTNIAAAGFVRLNGGDNVANLNRIEGGVINGPGPLVAINTRVLDGFGTINAPVTFQNSTSLRANDGTLTVNGAINEANTIGTSDNDGILNVVNAWNTNVAANVTLKGGTLQGGAMTVANINGINGHGTVTARVVNNTRLVASDASTTLIFQTAANDNDWDGGSNAGQLFAQNGTLEVRDNATFTFGGTVNASSGGKVYASGFGFNMGAASSILLSQGTFQTDESTQINGTVTVNGASPSTIQVQVNRFLDFKTGSNTTLNQNLTLLGNNISIEAGAIFSGNGAIVLPAGNHLILEAGENANVLLDMRGSFRPSGFETIGQVTVKDFQEAATSDLLIELTGTGLNQYDRVSVNGIAEIDGHLDIDIDGGFVPALGNTFNILSASGGVVGHFDSLSVSGTPAGLTFKINYLPTIVQVEVISGTEFETWINLFTSITNPADRLRTADPDHDGMNNLVEFALDGDPTTGKPSGKVVAKIAPVSGVNALTLTFPVRYANEFYDPPGGEFRMIGLTTPTLYYKAQATDDFVSYPLTVDRLTGADATAIQAGLPMLSPGWTYTTCRSPGPVAGDPREFMRLDISEGTFPPP
ncbi:beta strand repeat-containing protein [Luteolibacter soli]|uniref:Uncharacterized protein n=1 Tax=Luteolibacter soli TaxID=3135280 RepID=A0ABU9ATC4_9BACT